MPKYNSTPVVIALQVSGLAGKLLLPSLRAAFVPVHRYTLHAHQGSDSISKVDHHPTNGAHVTVTYSDTAGSCATEEAATSALENLLRLLYFLRFSKLELARKPQSE